MKIWMIINQFFPLIGGAEKQAHILAKSLIEKGNEVKIITGHWVSKTPKKEIIDNIEIVRLSSAWKLFNFKGIRTIGRFLFLIRLIIYLIINGKKADIFHIHQLNYLSFGVVFAANILKKPTVIKMAMGGNYSDVKETKRFPAGSFFIKYIKTKADKIVILNNYMKNELVTEGFSDKKIIRIPNGVEFNETIKKEYKGRGRILFVGRLSWQKRVDLLIDAFSNLIKKGNFRLIIFGKGPAEKNLIQKAKMLNLEDKIDFMGWASSIDKWKDLGDIFVLPSIVEGMPNVLLEAMAIGFPIIATDVGANRELLELEMGKKIEKGGFLIGKGGVLVNPKDQEGLTNAIFSLSQDKLLRERLGKSAREIIKNKYRIEKIADEYIKIYNELIDAKR